MRISDDVLRKIRSDLGLNVLFVKGQSIEVKNCWHFYTDGQSVDYLFCEDDDFRNGMNRIFVTVRSYDVVILAFVLMDTHVHFVLYGSFEDANRFVHEYIRRTSIYMANKYSERKKFRNLPVGHQVIDTDRYLKSAICYVIKNPTVGGLPWMFYDYPWSSGLLYFRSRGAWNSPHWEGLETVKAQEDRPEMSKIAWKRMMRTRSSDGMGVQVIDDVIFPGEYVASDIVEQLFRSPRGFLYFVGVTKDSDIESRGGAISSLSIPDNEMRQHKNEACQALFGVSDSRQLDTEKRIRLARKLKSAYNSSSKQIARICGLKYAEVKDILG